MPIDILLTLVLTTVIQSLYLVWESFYLVRRSYCY